MSNQKRWAVLVPEQYADILASSEQEAKAKAAKLLRGVKYEVTSRPHGPEQCWCGDDHSP